MKKALKVIMFVVIGFVVVVGGMGIFISYGVNDAHKIEIADVDLSRIEDGSYTGSFQNGRWSNEVVVEVKNHAIVSIAVTKDVMISDENVKNRIIADVIRNQTCKVDAISGATVTCKSYLKAVQNALSQE